MWIGYPVAKQLETATSEKCFQAPESQITVICYTRMQLKIRVLLIYLSLLKPSPHFAGPSIYVIFFSPQEKKVLTKEKQRHNKRSLITIIHREYEQAAVKPCQQD